MRGLHVEEPAVHLDISSLSPVLNFLGHEHALFPPPHFKQEGLSLSENGAKLQHPSQLSSPSHSLNKVSSTIGEERTYRWPDCGYGALLCAPTEINSWDINFLGNMVVPVAEKKRNYGELACRGLEALMEGDAQAELGHTGVSTSKSRVADAGGLNGYVGNRGDQHFSPAQASMAAPLKGVNVDRLSAFKGFEENDADLMNTLQGSMAASLKGSCGHLGRFGEHMGVNGANYLNDSVQASMVALTCGSPQRDNPFWRFLPCNVEKHSIDFLSSDEFFLYEFKVRRCMRGRSHDWTECPFAHPGEKARRRDPRCFNYSGTACPDFRRGTCRRGDSCELSHGVFECWLHPARYRTQLCKDGKACKRRVCFFAHSLSELRIVCPDVAPKNDQFPHKMPLPSLMDNMAGYFNSPPKQQPPPFPKQASPTGHGEVNGYGANGFFDDFNPKSINDFSTGGIQNGIHPMSAHRQNPNCTEGLCVNRDSESRDCRIMDFPNGLEHKSPQDHSHSYESPNSGLLDDYGYEDNTGCSYLGQNVPPPPSLDNLNLKGNANFRTHVALANLKGSLDQMVSPTSTLAQHVFSPPPLSPPLSPSESPPISPGMALSTWSTALSRKITPLAGHPMHDAFPQSPTSGVDATRASPLSSSASGKYGLSMHASTHGPSPLSVTSNGGQTDEIDVKAESVEAALVEANPALAHLISTLQQIELRCAATMDMKTKRMSSYLFQRMQEAPKSRLEAGHGESWDARARDESGQGLKGRYNGNLSKEETDNPDLGWVNELVK